MDLLGVVVLLTHQHRSLLYRRIYEIYHISQRMKRRMKKTSLITPLQFSLANSRTRRRANTGNSVVNVSNLSNITPLCQQSNQNVPPNLNAKCLRQRRKTISNANTSVKGNEGSKVNAKARTLVTTGVNTQMTITVQTSTNTVSRETCERGCNTISQSSTQTQHKVNLSGSRFVEKIQGTDKQLTALLNDLTHKHNKIQTLKQTIKMPLTAADCSMQEVQTSFYLNRITELERALREKELVMQQRKEYSRQHRKQQSRQEKKEFVIEYGRQNIYSRGKQKNNLQHERMKEQILLLKRENQLLKKCMG